MKTKRGSACFTFCFVPAASKFATKTTLTTPTTPPTPQFLSDVRSRVSRCRDDLQTSENSSFRHFPYRNCFLCFFFIDIGQDNRDAIELKFELFFFPMMKSLMTGDSFGKSFSC